MGDGESGRGGKWERGADGLRIGEGRGAALVNGPPNIEIPLKTFQNRMHIFVGSLEENNDEYD